MLDGLRRQRGDLANGFLEFLVANDVCSSRFLPNFRRGLRRRFSPQTSSSSFGGENGGRTDPVPTGVSAGATAPEHEQRAEKQKHTAQGESRPGRQSEGADLHVVIGLRVGQSK